MRFYQRCSFLDVCLLGVVFISNIKAQPIWESMNGPYGGQVNALTFKSTNSYLFAGTQTNGMFRSTDYGNSWKSINSGIPILEISSLAINQNGDVFAGAFRIFRIINDEDSSFVGFDTLAIFRSTNNGDTWSKTKFTRGKALSLAIDQNNRIFVGTDKGIFKSIDNGNSWIHVRVMNFNVWGLIVNQNGHIFAATNDSGIYRSIDNGISWSQINSGLNSLQMFSFAINPSSGEIYAGGNDIYNSNNNGDTWTQIGTFGPTRSIAIDASTGYLFVGTESAIYRSTDNGVTWTQLTFSPYLNMVRSIQINSSHIFAGTGGIGVFGSSNNGDSWAAKNNGLFASIIKSLLVDANGNIFAGSAGNAIHRTTDIGASWTNYPSSFSDPQINALAYNPTNKYLYAGSFNGVYRSTNDGTIWTKSSNGMTTNKIYSLAVDVMGRLYAGTADKGIFRSMDDGMNWTQINNGLTDSIIYSIAISNASGSKGNIYIGTEHKGIFLSTDNGNSWSKLWPYSSHSKIYSMAINQKKGYVFAGTWNGLVYTSTDKGVSWSATAVSYPVYSLVVHPSGNVYAGTSNGVRYAFNGSAWTNISSGLSNLTVYSLAIDSNGFLYAGTGGTGVYRTRFIIPINLESFMVNAMMDAVHLSWITATETNNYGFEIERKVDGNWSNIGFVNGNGTSSSRHEYSFVDNNVEMGKTYQYRLKQIDVGGTYENSQIVEIKIGEQQNDFRLSQNYPNPISVTSNQSTMISFSIRERSHVMLKLFDFLGRDIATLIDGEKSSGQHQVNFNAHGLTDGIYFYKISTGGKTETKKLIIIR